jgi:HJR/Mrr/RecB family endonuclease
MTFAKNQMAVNTQKELIYGLTPFPFPWNITAIHRLYPDLAPPRRLIQVIQTISAELIKYLKAHPRELDEIRPRQFEELIAEILASFGWEVRLTPPTKDGGYDIYAITKDVSGKRIPWLIECKKYARQQRVGVDVVRCLYGTKLLLGKDEANLMLATTSHFTKGVHDFKASRYDLHLRDYEGILEWINEYKPNPNGRLYIKEHRLIVPGEQQCRKR